IAWIRVRYAENEGVRIDEMLHYLDKDTLYFSNGIAEDMEQLWELLEDTDGNILTLRGGLERYDEISPDADSDEEPGFGGIITRTLARLRSRVTRPRPEESEKAGKELENSEWRQAHLELAAGQLIAFANQKLIEHKFN